MKYLLLIFALSGCAATQTHHAGVIKPSETQYVRDTQGRTIARIDKSGNVFNTSGVRVARINKK
jgi:hypothetical protein